MQSDGGLARADDFTGSRAILSGPAGGVVGQAYVAQQAGFTKAIGFDMGGTSTDVALIQNSKARVRREHDAARSADGQYEQLDQLVGAVAEQELRRHFDNIHRTTITDIGAALGVHGGPGTLIVATQPYSRPTGSS